VRSFLDHYVQVDVRLLLVDRVVSQVDEGLDLGVRLGHLPDSSLRAVRVGEVRRAIYASPEYLSRSGVPRTPHDLGNHRVIACTAVTPIADRWPFYGKHRIAPVTVKPRLVVNTTDAAVDSALDGLGLACVMSYQADLHVAAGRLREVLVAYEPPPLPIHIVRPAGSHLPTKVRLFLDHAAQGLRRKFGA